eukprot:TRINITY_DN3558_c0_g3_i1.p1 TRINITY_DN3558_c0_g3~~TRINITY_DN3558_c0_g3_i1.p1  ORF type:complete len:546 (-),score=98.54 TRINITY_DN3558_c0_g3_i1:112-1749(-)
MKLEKVFVISFLVGVVLALDTPPFTEYYEKIRSTYTVLAEDELVVPFPQHMNALSASMIMGQIGDLPPFCRILPPSDELHDVSRTKVLSGTFRNKNNTIIDLVVLKSFVVVLSRERLLYLYELQENRILRLRDRSFFLSALVVEPPTSSNCFFDRSTDPSHDSSLLACGDKLLSISVVANKITATVFPDVHLSGTKSLLSQGDSLYIVDANGLRVFKTTPTMTLTRTIQPTEFKVSAIIDTAIDTSGRVFVLTDAGIIKLGPSPTEHIVEADIRGGLRLYVAGNISLLVTGFLGEQHFFAELLLSSKSGKYSLNREYRTRRAVNDAVDLGQVMVMLTARSTEVLRHSIPKNILDEALNISSDSHLVSKQLFRVRRTQSNAVIAASSTAIHILLHHHIIPLLVCNPPLEQPISYYSTTITFKYRCEPPRQDEKCLKQTQLGIIVERQVFSSQSYALGTGLLIGLLVAVSCCCVGIYWSCQYNNTKMELESFRRRFRGTDNNNDLNVSAQEKARLRDDSEEIEAQPRRRNVGGDDSLEGDIEMSNFE